MARPLISQIAIGAEAKCNNYAWLGVDAEPVDTGAVLIVAIGLAIVALAAAGLSQ